MKVLIVHAGRYGSTTDVAESIGDALRESGHSVVVWAAGEVPSPCNYDLILLGSAVCAGRVRGDLQRYVAQYRSELGSKRIAWFAVADGCRDHTEESHRQVEAALLPLEQGLSCVARGSFAGRGNPRRMPLPVRFLMRLRPATSGDDRTRDEIHAWASDLSTRLAA